jgi:hypothetical protein
MAKISASIDFRWPCPDDRLVRKAVDWRNAITFSDYPTQRHALILDGYFRAAHALVDHCGTKMYKRQTMIYPILFCYRHALEMAMKWIVGSYGDHYGVSLPELDHNLWHLWQACRAIFTQVDDESAAVGTSTVEKLLKEFHDLDTSAEAFRYPVKKKDGSLIPLPDIAIDLINLREVMEGLEHFFSGADGYLDHLRSASDEMQYY